jgi:hypothetical protein
MNSSVIWHAIPAYYYAKMGDPVGGIRFDRYGDVLSGFFVQLCADAVGQRIAVGAPLVRHNRHLHSLFKDLWQELPGMVLIDEMLPVLEAPLTPSRQYDVAYLELADRLDTWARGKNNVFLWGDAVEPWMGNLTDTMRAWVDVCRQLARERSLSLDCA